MIGVNSIKVGSPINTLFGFEVPLTDIASQSFDHVSLCLLDIGEGAHFQVGRIHEFYVNHSCE
jgi:hypothetical protein